MIAGQRVDSVVASSAVGATQLVTNESDSGAEPVVEVLTGVV